MNAYQSLSQLAALLKRPSKAEPKHRRRRIDRPACVVEPLEQRALLTTYAVTNLLDSGLGSLRGAITAANAHAGADEITFGNLRGVVTLTSGQLEIDDDVTIVGPGAKGLAISGNNASRIFDIIGGKVSISGLTIHSGRGDSDFDHREGGGIVNTGTLTVIKSIFARNFTIGAGGGIVNRGTLTVAGSTFSANSGGIDGGAIANESGTAVVTNCTFSANSAPEVGGAIYNGSALTIANSTFSANASGFEGGGICNTGVCTLAITNSTFSGNSASEDGGGIANFGTLTIMSSTFSGNSASKDGGGIANAGKLTVMSCTFSGNSAFTGNYDGGGINNEFSGTLAVTNSTFSGNSGGGISNYGTLTITNSTLSGNSHTSSGGGIYNFPGDNEGDGPGTLNIGNTIVAGNSAPSGSDVFGPAVSKGHNLIGITDGSSGWQRTDRTGTIVSPLDAKLAALADNGGPTNTIALLTGSPAINAGNDALVSKLLFSDTPIDQRGKSRIAGIRVDIGAFEVQSAK